MAGNRAHVEKLTDESYNVVVAVENLDNRKRVLI